MARVIARRPSLDRNELLTPSLGAGPQLFPRRVHHGEREPIEIEIAGAGGDPLEAAEGFLAIDRPALAAEQLDRLRHPYLEVPYIAWLRIRSLLENGDLDRAVRIAEKVERLHHDHPQVLGAVASVHWASGAVDRAERALLAAIKSDVDPDSLCRYADLLKAHGQHRKSRFAIDEAERIASDADGERLVLRTRIAHLLHDGELDSARDCAEALAQLDPDDDYLSFVEAVLEEDGEHPCPRPAGNLSDASRGVEVLDEDRGFVGRWFGGNLLTARLWFVALILIGNLVSHASSLGAAMTIGWALFIVLVIVVISAVRSDDE